MEDFSPVEKEIYKVLSTTRNGIEFMENEYLENGLLYGEGDWVNFDLENVKIRETPKAFLFKDDCFMNNTLNNEEHWIPKSVCTISDSGVILTIPRWLFNKIEENYEQECRDLRHSERLYD